MVTDFSVKKPFTIIVTIIIIMILGGISLVNMSADLLPSINLPYAIVTTPYPGSAPEEVEMNVTKPVEQAMASISNIKNLKSISRENMSMVTLEFTASANMDSAIIEMRESLDRIMTYMPDEVGNPIIIKLNPDMMPVMVASVAVEGQKISQSSKFIEKNIIPELESVEGIASVNPSGLVQKEILIKLNQQNINQINQKIATLISSMEGFTGNNNQSDTTAYKVPGSGFSPGGFGAMTPGGNNSHGSSGVSSLNMSDLSNFKITKELVSGIIKGQNFSMPVGYITTNQEEYIVRTGDEIKNIDELKNLTILSLPIPIMDSVVLEDIADIEVTDNSDEMYSKVNGNDAVILVISKQTEYVTADIARDLRHKIDSIMDKYEDVEINPLMDQGQYIDLVVTSISSNLIFGSILAILILFVFLRDYRPTIIVGFAIPISLVTAFVLMYFSNVTLNIISMGGLALGVGMLVDNSIVVIENIYRLRHQGEGAKEAAVKGASQVAGAITASTLTTIAVFAPILFTQGWTRQIFSDMGLTIAYSLLASLFISLTFVPMIASKIMLRSVNRKHKILDFITEKYTGILKYSLSRKRFVILFVLVLFISSIIVALNSGTELFPASNTDQLMVDFSMPRGTDFDDTKATANKIIDEISRIDDVKTVGASVSGGMFGGMGPGGSTGGKGSVSLYVLLKDNRENSSSEIGSIIRDRTKRYNVDININDSGMDMMAMNGGAITINIRGRDTDVLETTAVDIAKLIKGVKGTVEVSDGLEETTSDLLILVKKDLSIAYGLTVAQVFMEVSKLLNSNEIVSSIGAGSDVYDIIISENQNESELTLEGIKNLSISTPFGEAVAVKDIADLKKGISLSSIRRENQQRYISVTLGIAEAYNIGIVSEKIQDKLDQYDLPEGFTIDMGGEQKQINESFKDLFLMLTLAVIFIYLIMVAQFESLLSPFIVMFTIPLAFTGGLFSLILTGNPVSIVAFIGLIILSGVVVNNGIVFVDYINILRRDGMKKREAIIKAGIDRLRPIVMTALTTIIALSTMAVGVGTGTELIQPMAITAIGGLIYATFLTLILIPVLYDSFNKKELK